MQVILYPPSLLKLTYEDGLFNEVLRDSRGHHSLSLYGKLQLGHSAKHLSLEKKNHTGFKRHEGEFLFWVAYVHNPLTFVPVAQRQLVKAVRLTVRL